MTTMDLWNGEWTCSGCGTRDPFDHPMSCQAVVFDPDVISVAVAFRLALVKELHPQEFAEMIRRNCNEDDPAVCHSHDFCDANELMNQAFIDKLGHPFNSDSDYDRAVWDTAWTAAELRR